MMEKSWVIMMHQTDKEHKQQEEACSTSEVQHATKRRVNKARDCETKNEAKGKELLQSHIDLNDLTFPVSAETIHKNCNCNKYIK